ncbi:MAG: Crotonobetainyl-CoA dehydrogenase [Anaerolineae bacterium]|nr:Crotonobetainyl-CoA dehydrogenase [Anaerolineae bacterium]
MTTDAAAQGRANLAVWEASKPVNFFTADANLQSVLRRILGDAAYVRTEANLTRFGGQVATALDQWAREEDLIGNHPRLDRYDGIGRRTEQVAFHPNHERAGALIWASDMLALQAEPGHIVEQMALFYLLSHNGEGGHCCSIACTAGLIRALQTVGSESLKARFLAPLVGSNFDTMQHGAQFLTEIQGGSDVGANALRAADQGDGTFRLTGEKWFCSNVNADQFLVMGRPEGASSGTRGLAVFVVPRLLDDGSTNGFFIRRLKDKLGTRTLASVELDFDEAVAYPLGPLDQGFKTTVELVLNTSRLLNAVSCAGVMRRAAIEAASYAAHRTAFGQVIGAYPLVQEAVADCVSEYTAATASGFALAALLDLMETGRASEDQQAVYRVLVNLNKYATSVRGSHVVHRAIEVLGGNGAIESFSVLPRLYRDMVVLESWEGTHNVLCLQVQRDMQRYGLHKPFLRWMDERLDSVTAPALAQERAVVASAVERGADLLARITALSRTAQQAHARRLADILTDCAQAALLLEEAQWGLDRGLATAKPQIIAHFVNAHLRPGYDPLDDPGYLDRIRFVSEAALRDADPV